MALFMPSYIIPDVRSGIGMGVVDATADMTVSWHINGQSAMTSFCITIYENNAASTQVYTTGNISTGCPAYGTSSTGEMQFFSYKITAATLSSAGITNGNEYKLVIKQGWLLPDSSTYYIEQSSASVFLTRSAPTISINTIGVAGVISTRYYTFTGAYSQSDGDVLNWLRWQIAYADATDDPFFDTENISGTQELSCYFDGFIDDVNYVIKLSIQTENGVEADTGWVPFSASYSLPEITGIVTANCTEGTDAVLVEWSGIGYVPGEASGDYEISEDYILTLASGATITWDEVNTLAMSYSAPWSVIWKGRLTNDVTVFKIGQTGGDIVLQYDFQAHSLILKKGATTLVTQTGIINQPLVTAVLTNSKLYLRSEYKYGGLYPANNLYPGNSLYPKADTIDQVDTYTLSPSYTQQAVTSVQIGGYQECHYIEALDGTADADTITAAITNGTYVPSLDENAYMLADWTNGLNAGNINIGGDTIQGYALYRRQGATGRLVKIADTGIEQSFVYDYGATSQQGPYTYYLFPVGTTTYIASPIISDPIYPCWWNWTLLECTESTSQPNTFTVLSAYRFRNNVSSGAITNNNNPTILNNFTPYPKIQLVPQNYKSGSLTALIGAVKMLNGKLEYIDTVALRDAIYALSVSQNDLFLKNRKGDLIRVRTSGAISMATDDNTKEQMQTMTLPWSEVGSAKNANLYALSNVGVAP